MCKSSHWALSSKLTLSAAGAFLRGVFHLWGGDAAATCWFVYWFLLCGKRKRNRIPRGLFFLLLLLLSAQKSQAIKGILHYSITQSPRRSPEKNIDSKQHWVNGIFNAQFFLETGINGTWLEFSVFNCRMKEQDQKRGSWICCNLLIFLIVFKDF